MFLDTRHFFVCHLLEILQIILNLMTFPLKQNYRISMDGRASKLTSQSVTRSSALFLILTADR
jgi:hypothetical protein